MNEIKIPTDPFDSCRAQSYDVPLLRQLGLAIWTSKCGVEVHIGDVRPFQEHQQPSEQTLISVYVQPMPAQAFRFEIVRPSEEFDGMEKLTVRTGTGSLAQFWDMALAVAGCTLVVTTPERI